jgi:hypothetical protein
MSICKKDFTDSMLREEVVELYRKSSLTMQQVADELGTGHHTVCAILRAELSAMEFAELKANRYAVSKTGERNPMLGKRPGNFKGHCPDGRGYLTEVVRGKRYFVQRIVMAETILGIPVESLPDSLVVHHIDENPLNNSPDNLALCTKAGHARIHWRLKVSVQG